MFMITKMSAIAFPKLGHLLARNSFHTHLCAVPDSQRLSARRCLMLVIIKKQNEKYPLPLNVTQYGQGENK
jgi:hypothetical protein